MNFSPGLTAEAPIYTAREGIQEQNQEHAYKDAVYRRFKEWISSTLILLKNKTPVPDHSMQKCAYVQQRKSFVTMHHTRS
jgi:hypothetical protein